MSHKNVLFFCEKKKREIKYDKCEYLNPVICPFFRSCLIRVIRQEQIEQIKQLKLPLDKS